MGEWLDTPTVSCGWYWLARDGAVSNKPVQMIESNDQWYMLPDPDAGWGPGLMFYLIVPPAAPEVST